MLQLSQCKLSWQEDSFSKLQKKAAKLLGISVEDLTQFTIVKRSLDARKKPNLFVLYTVRFSCRRESEVLKRNRKNKNLTIAQKEPSLWRQIEEIKNPERVVVVGAGPAGLFSAYYLSLCGYSPIVIERGAKMEERHADIQKFWQEGVLKPDSNVAFGEGGAGTFSDGKLNTGVKDKTGRKQFVLQSFVNFGAPEEILYDAKPHIGTDVLQTVITNMRLAMEQKGCEFLFHTKMIKILEENGRVRGVLTQNGEKEEPILCDRVILAIGHSARDTFELLKKEHITMSQKPFAMGVRVQHRQEDIDCAQYGFNDEKLPASPYKLTGKTTDGRGVYSFCMCPGGYVVNASSEEGGLVVNGMSNADRASGFANSAIVVSVSEEDFEGDDCLAGVALQRKYEKLAYELADGEIPVQRYEDFCNNQPTKALGKVAPCVEGKWQFSNIRLALQNLIINGIIDGMGQFAEKIHEFDHQDTLLLGLESRTSSPVRIERDEDFESVSLAGLYPCGEGAGYAGGIMSAAMDGLRIAMKIQEKKKEESNHA